MERKYRESGSFVGTLENCVEAYGGRSAFAEPHVFALFSGARLERYRRAEAKDGSMVILERNLASTECEVYLKRSRIRPQPANATKLVSECA
jgi:hypothetical protein